LTAHPRPLGGGQIVELAGYGITEFGYYFGPGLLAPPSKSKKRGPRGIGSAGQASAYFCGGQEKVCQTQGLYNPAVGKKKKKNALPWLFQGLGGFRRGIQRLKGGLEFFSPVPVDRGCREIFLRTRPPFGLVSPPSFPAGGGGGASGGEQGGQ